MVTESESPHVLVAKVVAVKSSYSDILPEWLRHTSERLFAQFVSFEMSIQLFAVRSERHPKRKLLI